jgi:hypothetical protein
VGLDRPNVSGDPYVRNMTALRWLLPAAFSANPIGTFGNAGAYSLSGPGFVNVDLALTRSFRIRESHQLDVRFENFNALNHPNFSNPTGNLSSNQFGLITSAKAPRILQLAMKYVF